MAASQNVKPRSIPWSHRADPYPPSIPKRRWSRAIHTSGSLGADPYPNFGATPYVYIYVCMYIYTHVSIILGETWKLTLKAKTLELLLHFFQVAEPGKPWPMFLLDLLVLRFETTRNARKWIIHHTDSNHVQWFFHSSSIFPWIFTPKSWSFPWQVLCPRCSMWWRGPETDQRSKPAAEPCKISKFRWEKP